MVYNNGMAGNRGIDGSVVDDGSVDFADAVYRLMDIVSQNCPGGAGDAGLGVVIIQGRPFLYR
jgi:hypothetical protein